MRSVLQRCLDMGVNSVSNIGPSLSYVDKDSVVYQVLTKSGIRFEHEVEMLALAQEMGHVTVGLAFDLEDSLALARGARPDVFCFHAGTTKGGRTGYDSGETIAETARRTEAVYAAVRKIHPQAILVAHGAAMETPEDAQYVLDHTSGHGFWTGSSTERLPIERAVSAAAREFAALSFPKEPAKRSAQKSASKSAQKR
jgi:predicted TIM-barrel enzyme